MSEAPSLASTYGAWLASLFVETLIYGVGLLQTSLYYRWYHADPSSIQLSVAVVLQVDSSACTASVLSLAHRFFETVQISFFFRSSYVRFVDLFGTVQTDLLWSDSIQLLANYFSAFTVQIFLTTRIHLLITRDRDTNRAWRLGIYVVWALALLQLSAGIAQTVRSYQLRSYAKLETTKATTALQTSASVACDILIAVYLCVFLARKRKGLSKAYKYVLKTLMIQAVNRGLLTALSSAFTMILFIKYPGTFWFFLTLAPNSKLYMNSMLATLNIRHKVRHLAGEPPPVDEDDEEDRHRSSPLRFGEVSPLHTETFASSCAEPLPP